MIPLATFGNLFSGDGIIIFLILLLLFGAKKLPELAKGLGSAVREFSKAKDEIHSEMTRAASPQHPQIEPPKYTEPHVAGVTNVPEHTDAYGHTDEHGYVVPPDPVPSMVGAHPDVIAATPVKPLVTEEHDHHSTPLA